MNKIILEELENMKYLFGYKPGVVISEQTQPAASPAASSAASPAASPAASSAEAPPTVEDAVKKIQTILNTKYGAKLNVDGKWGNLTQTALEQAMVKVKSATPPVAPVAPVAPAPGTQTPAPVNPLDRAIAKRLSNTLAAPVTPKATGEITPPVAPVPAAGTEVAQPTNRDERRARQDIRRDQRRARQDLRAQQRGQ
jgi:hypothetical protein